ncbi:hypothetical protein [Micromonospora sp. CA-111912]|uniref:hypothetical protein n=1 Tax=Micromonospora sp. CA-111912 TaxID=3239955 RepID=UPI003D91B941
MHDDKRLEGDGTGAGMGGGGPGKQVTVVAVDNHAGDEEILDKPFADWRCSSTRRSGASATASGTPSPFLNCAPESR